MKILITDDQEGDRELMKDILDPFGHCTLAGDGREAVIAFEDAMEMGERFDLVTLDVQMPNMDGHEALDALRTIERKLKIPVQQETIILMATTMDSPEHYMKALNYGGCNDYFIKPVTKSLMVNYLTKHRLIKE